MPTADYIYCSRCGYEDFEVEIIFAAQYANGDFYFCPKCHYETSHVEIEIDNQILTNKICINA